MPVLAQTDTAGSLEEGLATVVAIIPQVLTFLLILVIGYFIAKAVAKAIAAVLEKVGFDRAVERGGVKKALDKSKFDPSDILGQLAFYALFLFVLQLAFGVFGPNPISDLITGVIGYLPRVFVAIIIIVVASAIAAAVKEIVEASLGGLSYGRALAFAASSAILVVGVFAALSQLQIAPAIVNGLFYALLAIIAGSAIVAVGGGGIVPMRRYWERSMDRMEEEAPKLQQEAAGSKEKIQERAQERKQQAQSSGESSGRPQKGRTVRLDETTDTGTGAGRSTR